MARLTPLTMVETGLLSFSIVSFVRCAGSRFLSPQQVFHLIRFEENLPGWSFCALQPAVRGAFVLSERRERRLTELCGLRAFYRIGAFIDRTGCRNVFS